MTEFAFSYCRFCPAEDGQLILRLDDSLRQRLIPNGSLTVLLDEEPTQKHVTVRGQHPDAVACPHLLVLVGNAQIRHVGDPFRTDKFAFAWTHRLLHSDKTGRLQPFLWDLLDGDVATRFIPTVDFHWDEFDRMCLDRQQLATEHVELSVEGCTLFARRAAHFLGQARRSARKLFVPQPTSEASSSLVT